MDYSKLDCSSKRDMCEMAGNIARSTAIRTFEAIGISTSKTTYSEKEVAAFLWARFLFDQGFTSKQVAQAFENKDTHIVVTDETSNEDISLDHFLSCFEDDDLSISN
ncbi:hypothetical protein I4641_13735 [Waterburya agarophytonicola K14]|uniref:Uncharacterized protein n=1 Tax=Waterburya agarophytonicola KI4 TaxID=2874699 RepID=A0A964BSN5_9CYAN|nr:hypothetical protein [Waterburya agarophytonicola]MCC0178041.1 hypothetical protein [Waterburya agarophytonicola KI4]